MGERFRYELAMSTAETMYLLWEIEYQQHGRDLDAMMRRLKDLSAYSLSQADILGQREGVELLALGMFFGLSSNTRLWPNQERLHHLAAETFDYQGQAENVEREVKWRASHKPRQADEDDTGPRQPRLL